MKKSIITLTLIILLIFVGTIVLATSAPSVSATITPSVTQVSEGGNLSVTLNVSNITFTAGINSVTLKVDYDTQIFEALDTTSFDVLNNWTVKEVYEPLSQSITLTRGTAQGLQTQPGDIVKVDFKVKTGTDGKTTVIKFKDMEFRDGYSTPYSAPDISTSTITIGTQVISPIQDAPTPIQTQTPTPVQTQTPTPVVNTNQKDKPEEIPETGLSDTLTYIIIALILASIVFYINYKKLEKKNIRYVDVE